MAESGTMIESEAPALEYASPPRPSLESALSPYRKLADNMFGLDYRSLALFRIFMGICLFWVAYTNGLEMRAFYSDDGVLPRWVMFRSPPAYSFSLFFADGDMPFVAALFTIQIIFSLMMVAGYRTRLATIGSYILLLSMHNRQPALLYGADTSLRVGLFFAMFLPLANRFSMDSVAGRVKPARRVSYLGIAGLAFIFQVGMIYIGGALMKTGQKWTDGTAVSYALSLDVYSRPFGQWLNQYEWLTRFLTVFTLYAEKFGPLLFVMPVFSKWTRMAGILMFAGLQAGFDLSMSMGIFGLVMVTLTLVFLPPFFWDRIAGPMGRWLARKLGSVARLVPMWVRKWGQSWAEREKLRNAETPLAQPRAMWYLKLGLKLARDGVLVYLMYVVFLWNMGNLSSSKWRPTATMVKIGYSIGINQMWDMFAPEPHTIDGWFVVAGTLRDGRTVDLMTGASPVSYDKPASVSGSYPSQIWMSYLISYWPPSQSDPASFSRYLRTTWNETHSVEDQLKSVQIDMMEETVYPGPTKGDAVQQLIWQESFPVPP